VDVNYVLQLGDKLWDIRFEVISTLASVVLSFSSWIALVLVLCITLGAAASAERRHRQDMRLEQMSRTLEGAHNELQSRISERDKLFHALRKSERENRAVINSVSDVIFETDENGKLVFLNETWKRITDFDTAATLGHSLFDKLDIVDRPRQREMFEELLRGERQAYRAETRLDLGHGTLKPVEIAFSMVRMAEDKSIRIVGTITDIEKRRRAEMAVREAEHRFRAIFENSISGIYQTSPEGRFISANPALAEILGYASADELISSVTNIGLEIYARQDDRKAFVQKLLFEGKVSGIETEVIRKDGRKIWIMENARVVRSEKGGVQYYEGSVWDVTQRKEAEEAMRQARLQAEISSRSRMEFLANMSHELRTPLNAIIGFSEIIKDEVMGSLGVDVYKEYAKDIYDSGNYLLKVISEILEVSKIETGNRELNLNTFRLTRALKSCMTIMSSRVDEAGVDVSIDVPDTLPELLAEELGFKQIMLNLIGNAIKFTPKGGKISVSARMADSGEMIIDIADTGIGMTEEEIVKAMQPFSKVDTNFSTMKAGTGLGLTIVESLVRLHGGQFRLISKKGDGTTARVVMPAFRVMRMTDAGTGEESPPAPHLTVVK
jgi:PAS domain S-box-containing protein